MPASKKGKTTAMPRASRARTRQLDKDADTILAATGKRPAQDESAVAPGIMPPSGINAKVRTQVEYQTQVDPNENRAFGRARAVPYNEPEEESAQLPDFEPPDELAEFCETWANFAGQNLEVVRLPDPPLRRRPGSEYARPCFDLERLGGMPFDPSNLVGSLQMINGNSGGAFRIWLTDSNGAIIQYGPYGTARLERIVIGDPPRGGFASGGGSGPGASRPFDERSNSSNVLPPPKSEFEKRMELIQERMMQRMLENLLEPPAPVTPPPPAQMSGEDQAALFLFKNTNFLSGVFEKMATVAATATEAPSANWRDRAIDAAVEIAKSNPAVVERVSETIERIISTIFPPRHAPAPAPQVVYHPPAVRVEPQPQPPSAGPVHVPDAPEPDDEEEDDELMTIIEDLIGLLSGTEPLRHDHPLFMELAQQYPFKFKSVIRIVATQPIDEIVAWLIASGPDVAAALLESEATGPHLRKRLAELQMLSRTPPPPQPEEREQSNGNETEPREV
jgi:hypothetical protein